MIIVMNWSGYYIIIYSEIPIEVYCAHCIVYIIIIPAPMHGDQPYITTECVWCKMSGVVYISGLVPLDWPVRP